MAKFDTTQAEREVDRQLDEVAANLNKKVVLAVIGQVSAGKSSLINAMFDRPRDNMLAQVGAISGVTTAVKKFPVGKHVEVWDLPGLGDVVDENSQVTHSHIHDVDVGILVVSGSVDVKQKENFQYLQDHCQKVFVVLNKIDEYDKKQAALQKVIEQWRNTLDLGAQEEIYPTCADGYDPDYDPEAEMNIRGVDKLKEAIFSFLKEHGKDLILRREMEEKYVIARRIVYTALTAAAAAAFIPGSAIYITGAQAIAIGSIHYVYTGEVISKNHVVAALPLFAAQSIGSSIFLVAKSFLPPTGILDVAAAGVAVSVTLAMLSAVNWVYENGYNLNDKQELKDQYNNFYKMLKDIGIGEIFDTIKSADKAAIMALIAKFIK